jgi:hypothetical protein
MEEWAVRKVKVGKVGGEIWLIEGSKWRLCALSFARMSTSRGPTAAHAATAVPDTDGPCNGEQSMPSLGRVP